MICPRCRKIYPEGVQTCPECDSQLIALMGEADAPIDRSNDNISSLDVVFSSESSDSYEQDTDLYQATDGEGTETESFDENDIGEVEFDDQYGQEAYEEEEYESEGDYDILDSDLDDSEFDEDVKIYISSTDKAFTQEQDSEADIYGEDYEIEFDDDYEYDEYSEDEEPDEETRSAVVYKNNRQSLSEQEIGEINEKNTKILTILIFAVAVLMIIVSVICFALGSTTELTEMHIYNLLFDVISVLK